MKTFVLETWRTKRLVEAEDLCKALQIPLTLDERDITRSVYEASEKDIKEIHGRNQGNTIQSVRGR